MDRSTFFFEDYSFNFATGGLELIYRYNDEQRYIERAEFTVPEDADEATLAPIIDAIAFYIFMIAGTSYYKLYAAPRIVLEKGMLDAWQAGFFNMLYRGGLSQYVYENRLDPATLARFEATAEDVETKPSKYDGQGVLLMESGGKDSLLSAELLKANNVDFTAWHMSTTGSYPPVLDLIGADIVTSKRSIDLEGVKRDMADGGMNGHVPFSALFAGFALLQAVLSGKQHVVASNEASADEANTVVNGYEVNHQFSKTFKVELSIQEYIHRYVSPDLNYVSVLRPFTELYVGELFAQYCWDIYKHDFSSCNLGNYKQGEDGKPLIWDGTCPKCANTFLLLAPFVNSDELIEIFNGKNLIQDDELLETYNQLFGFSDIKPFECVGTYDEMQQAYNMAGEKDERFKNPKLEASSAAVDYREQGNHQPLVESLIDLANL